MRIKKTNPKIFKKEKKKDLQRISLQYVNETKGARKNIKTVILYPAKLSLKYANET